MDKKDFENSLTRQARDTEKMVRVVFDSVTAQLGQTLTTKEVFDAHFHYRLRRQLAGRCGLQGRF